MEFKTDLESNIDPTQIRSRVLSNIKSLLKKRFADSNQKQQIVPRDGKLNFACPYCGDSHKYENKKRGNLFLDSWSYHCFNCGEHKNIFTLLKDWGNDEDITSSDQNWLLEQISEHKSDNELDNKYVGIKIDDLINVNMEEVLPKRSEIMKVMALEEIAGTPMNTYLRKRLQKPDIRFAYNRKSKDLWIFNLSTDGERVLGLQIKTFKFNTPYLTYGVIDIWRNILKIEPSDTMLEGLKKIDRISTIFNILNVDLGEKITIFEGPLDSFLFKNSVAITGVNKGFPIEVETKRFLLDNDRAGIHKSIDLLKEGETIFLWTKLFELHPELKAAGKIKDWNDLLIKAKMYKIPVKMDNILGCFSNDTLDVSYL